MRTSVTIPTLLLTLVAACEPEHAQPDSRPDFDRVEFVAFDDTDTTDDGDAEETGDAGMDGVDPLPDMAATDNDPCCFCLGGTLPECLPLDAEECAAYEAANGLESCDPTFDDCQCDVEPLPDMPAPDLLEGCCVCVDGLPVCEIWPSSPPLPACIGIFSSQCEFIDGELLCEVSCT